MHFIHRVYLATHTNTPRIYVGLPFPLVLVLAWNGPAKIQKGCCKRPPSEDLSLPFPFSSPEQHRVPAPSITTRTRVHASKASRSIQIRHFMHWSSTNVCSDYLNPAGRTRAVARKGGGLAAQTRWRHRFPDQHAPVSRAPMCQHPRIRVRKRRI